ncbi:MAG: hypothetical protein MHM6MM_006778 [Cercozoa sp. M6MM]
MFARCGVRWLSKSRSRKELAELLAKYTSENDREQIMTGVGKGSQAKSEGGEKPQQTGDEIELLFQNELLLKHDRKNSASPGFATDPLLRTEHQMNSDVLSRIAKVQPLRLVSAFAGLARDELAEKAARFAGNDGVIRLPVLDEDGIDAEDQDDLDTEDLVFPKGPLHATLFGCDAASASPFHVAVCDALLLPPEPRDQIDNHAFLKQMDGTENDPDPEPLGGQPRRLRAARFAGELMHGISAALVDPEFGSVEALSHPRTLASSLIAASLHDVSPVLRREAAAVSLLVLHPVVPNAVVTASIGDCTFAVFRPSENKFMHLPEFQRWSPHVPNFVTPPARHSRGVNPNNGALRELEVLPGDVVVMASDGLWDNVYPDEVHKLIRDAELGAQSTQAEVKACASSLVQRVITQAQGRKDGRPSPWAMHLMRQHPKSTVIDRKRGKQSDVAVSITVIQTAADTNVGDSGTPE